MSDEFSIALATELSFYSGVKSKRKERYGFDAGNEHIHCFSFTTTGDNKMVFLHDRDGYIIDKIPVNDILGISICNARYDEVVTCLFAKTMRGINHG
jgi:hypothetical protein